MNLINLVKTLFSNKEKTTKQLEQAKIVGKASQETLGRGYRDYEGHPVNRTWTRV